MRPRRRGWRYRESTGGWSPGLSGVSGCQIATFRPEEGHLESVAEETCQSSGVRTFRVHRGLERFLKQYAPALFDPRYRAGLSTVARRHAALRLRAPNAQNPHGRPAYICSSYTSPVARRHSALHDSAKACGLRSSQRPTALRTMLPPCMDRRSAGTLRTVPAYALELAVALDPDRIPSEGFSAPRPPTHPPSRSPTGRMPPRTGPGRGAPTAPPARPRRAPRRARGR